MHTPLLHFSFSSNHFFCASIRREIRVSRSRALDLKPGNPRWRKFNVGFGRRLLGGFASMAFSGGNGGFGKSDGNSGKRGDGDGEDGNRNILLGFGLPKETWKYVILFALWKLLGWSLQTDDIQELCTMIIMFPLILFNMNTLEFIVPCILYMVILAAALCAFGSFYLVKWVIRGSEQNASYPPDGENASNPPDEENASNPPDNVECCICLSTYEGTPIWRSLPCNHWFHSACINSWVRINPTCPICKRHA